MPGVIAVGVGSSGGNLVVSNSTAYPVAWNLDLGVPNAGTIANYINHNISPTSSSYTAPTSDMFIEYGTSTSSTAGINDSAIVVNPIAGFAPATSNTWNIVSFYNTATTTPVISGVTWTLPSCSLLSNWTETATTSAVSVAVTRSNGTFNWAGGGGSSATNWWNPANWTEGSPAVSVLAPISGDTADFALSSTAISVDVGTTSGTVVGLPAPAVGTISLSGSGALNINGGSSGSPLAVANSIAVGAGQTLQGNGFVSATGGIAVSGSSSSSRGTLGGTLTVTGSVNAGSYGQLTPGGAGVAGTVTISGALTTDSTTAFNFDLGSSSDQIIVGSLASNTVNGAVYITPGAGFASAATNTYPVIAYSSSGTAPTTNLAWGTGMPPTPTAAGAPR